MITEGTVNVVAMIEVPATDGKTVALVLTQEIQAWINAQALALQVSKSKVARDVFEKAMRESAGKAA